MSMRIENRKARFDYEIVDSVEAGIVLTGAEVKAIKGGQVNLTGARIIEKNGGLWVVGMNVARYKFSSDEEYDAARIRQLLVHKKEMAQIMARKRTAGLTLVALSVYNKGDLIKLEVGLVRGKKKYEKRELLKKKTEEKALARRLKN